MPKATMGGVECDVRVTQDLTENWSIEVTPKTRKAPKTLSFKPPPSSVIMKVRADNREAAIKMALESLKNYKRIDDYTLDPPPPAPAEPPKQG